RPARSADHVRPRGGDQPRHAHATRRAAAHVRVSRQPLRRRLHRRVHLHPGDGERRRLLRERRRAEVGHDGRRRCSAAVVDAAGAAADPSRRGAGAHERVRGHGCRRRLPGRDLPALRRARRRHPGVGARGHPRRHRRVHSRARRTHYPRPRSRRHRAGLRRGRRAVSAAAPALNARELARDARRERWLLFGLCSPALALVLVIMVVPVGWLFWLSIIGQDGTCSLENYQRMVVSSAYARIFRASFVVSVVTTGICILIGYPLAYLFAQMPKRLANLCLITVLLPFWTSLLVRTYAWLVLLQRRGLVNEWGIELGLWQEPLALVHNLNGTLIGMVHIMLPFLVLPVYGSMRA